MRPPLRQVVEEMAQYTQVGLDVADDVPDYPITGLIQIRSPRRHASIRGQRRADHAGQSLPRSGSCCTQRRPAPAMSRRPRTWPSRPAVAAAIAILATLVPFAGIAGAAPSDTGVAVALDEAMRRGSERYPSRTFPANPVGKALILFGQQTGLSVIVQHDAREVVTNVVAGTHTVPEGLRLLVQGTDLNYRYQDRAAWWFRASRKTYP